MLEGDGCKQVTRAWEPKSSPRHPGQPRTIDVETLKPALFEVAISKNLCGEGFQGSSFLPGVAGQAGFPAGLLEESGAIPAVFDGYLGEEQATARTHGHQQSVAANLNLVGSDGTKRRQDTEMNF